MLALRTSTSLSALGLMLGIGATSWLTALTYERAPATRPFAEVVMPGTARSLRQPAARVATPPAPAIQGADTPARALPTPVAAAPRRPKDSLVPVYMPSPRYPMSALRANHEGQVVLSVTVTPEGDVTDVSINRSSGDVDLDRSAEHAVRNWRFAAADHRPARFTADLPVRFELTR